MRARESGLDRMVETLVKELELTLEAVRESRWEWDDGSVESVTCTGVLEYIAGIERGRFMDELYRILVPEGTATIRVLYWNTSMAYHDYRLQWPPLAEQSFLMFNKDWREKNDKQVDLKCDFDFTYGFTYDVDTAQRNVETQAFNIKHYTNSANALQVTLTKRP